MENEDKPSNDNKAVNPIPQAHDVAILGPQNSPDISNHHPISQVIPETYQKDTSGINQVDQPDQPGIKAEVFQPLDQGQGPAAGGVDQGSKILCADRPINGSSSSDAVSIVPRGEGSEYVPHFDKAEAQKVRPPRLSDHRRLDRVPPGVAKKKYRYPTGARLGRMAIMTIKAMSKMGYSRNEIARAEKVSVNTVTGVLSRMSEYPSDLVELVKKTASSAYWVNARRSMDFIDDEKLAKSSAVQLATVSAIMVDKALLLDGKPTSRTEHVSASDPELEKQIEALETQLNTFKGVKTVYNVSDNTSTSGEGISNA